MDDWKMRECLLEIIRHAQSGDVQLVESCAKHALARIGRQSPLPPLPKLGVVRGAQ